MTAHPVRDELARVGLAVAAARKAAGLTQQQLASASHMSRTSIANIETGRQGVPSAALVEIAAALGTSTSLLLGENSIADSRIPTALAVAVTSQQREITRLLHQMSETLCDLATASERLEKVIAAWETRPEGIR
jgi:transcriptional regulator with XRE-family HTH domain